MWVTLDAETKIVKVFVLGDNLLLELLFLFLDLALLVKIVGIEIAKFRLVVLSHLLNSTIILVFQLLLITGTLNPKCSLTLILSYQRCTNNFIIWHSL